MEADALLFVQALDQRSELGTENAAKRRLVRRHHVHRDTALAQ
jgi:hypothetical protein